MLASGGIWARLLPECSFEEVSPSPSGAGVDAGDPVAAQRAALCAGGFAQFLAEAAADTDAAKTSEPRPVTIVVNDAHRFTDTGSFLDAVFAEVDASGSHSGAVPRRFRLLFAAGSHRSDAHERDAHERRILGVHRGRFDQVAWHDAYDPENLGELASFGLHRWLCAGGAILGCGSVEPHYFAGATGAHKTLTVGVMSMASLTENHKGALSPNAGGLRLDGNPIHQGVCRALQAIEASGARLFALNQVVVDGRITDCAAGSPLAALEALFPAVRRAFAVGRSAPADLVVARVAAPLDRDFYQADKGIKNTEAGVRDGGVMILHAACTHGIGIDHFVELLRAAPTHARACEIVDQRGYRLGDHKAVKLRYLTEVRGVRLAVVSPALDPALGAVIGARVFAEPEDAAVWARAALVGSGGTEIGSGSLRGLIVNDAGNLTLEFHG